MYSIVHTQNTRSQEKFEVSYHKPPFIFQKCWRCFKVIQGLKVRYQEKQFHPQCYACDMCKTSLKGKNHAYLQS